MSDEEPILAPDSTPPVPEEPLTPTPEEIGEIVVGFAVHDAEGRILRWGTTPLHMIDAQASEPGESVVAVKQPVSPKYSHIVDGYAVPRPTLDLPDLVEIAADGTDEAVLPGLPDPCHATIDGQPTEVTGGELVLTSIMVAEYAVILDQWPYMPQTVKVIANAPVA